MKKFFRIVLGVFVGVILAIIAVPLILVGIEKITSGSPVDVDDYVGSYQGVSAFDTSLVLRDDETFDLYENGEVLESGQVSSNEKDTLILSVSDGRGGTYTMDYRFNESGQYLYKENGSKSLNGNMSPLFSEDVNYGKEPTFDENGRTNQTFSTEYTSNVILTLKMSEDGTYSIERRDGLTNNVNVDYQGTYNLKGDILTLNYDGGTLIFIYAENEAGHQIFFDVYEKQE